MAERTVQSPREGLYMLNLPKDLAETLGMTTGKKVKVKMQNGGLFLWR